MTSRPLSGIARIGSVAHAGLAFAPVAARPFPDDVLDRVAMALRAMSCLLVVPHRRRRDRAFVIPSSASDAEMQDVVARPAAIVLDPFDQRFGLVERGQH